MLMAFKWQASWTAGGIFWLARNSKCCLRFECSQYSGSWFSYIFQRS